MHKWEILLVAVGLGIMALSGYLMRGHATWKIIVVSVGSGVLYAAIVGGLFLLFVALAMRNMH